MTAASVLGQMPLFSVLTSEQREALAQRVTPRLYQAGQVIFHQGDPGLSLYVIEAGQVKIVLPSEEGKEALLAVLGPGDFFGELSLFDGQPRSATAVAVSTTRAYTLDCSSFLDFLQSRPQAAIGLGVVLAARLRQMDERLSELAFLDLPGRMARRLLEMAESHGSQVPEGLVFDLPLSQEALGELVGATRQSVNKVLGQWQRQGILRRQRRRILLLCPEVLRRRFR
ncbi:MAG TPA: Crp/Fnr family transcriptional regulator [Dehalococcoidia bacterium]|nr:Crp/Fnr family transcriptional regulator [Dehalococcoidia bacterium]